jgi:hypothetical protein
MISGARQHDFNAHLKKAVMEVVADYSDCDLIAPLHDLIIELGSRGMLNAGALIAALEQWEDARA